MTPPRPAHRPSPVPPPARTTDRVLIHTRQLIGPLLRDEVDRLPARVRRVVGYQFGWWDAHGRVIKAESGKVLVPTLGLLCCQALGGEAGQGVPAAAASELLHNWALVQDDIMDGDVLRRHRPTAWKAFGTSNALLAADALLMLALQQLTAVDERGALACTRILQGAVLQLIEGEDADLAYAERPAVSMDECMAMTVDKTAEGPAACAMGARMASDDMERVEALRSFGECLGLAYQITDDLLGIWGDPSVTGKSAASDLTSRKKTVPVVAALNSATPAGRQLADLYQHEGPLGPDEITRAARLVQEAGGRAWAEQQATSWLAKAFGHLDSAAPAPQPRSELRALAHAIIQRNH
ncbi:polyprenyl synthetase family protein [Streptomyces sp. NPDC050211]|uniref:polyprenyl synthetase family protein n=1 Tax=Streptomyces sp. NPDC050211 TaxID=3154932 RepID=UPI0034183193